MAVVSACEGAPHQDHRCAGRDTQQNAAGQVTPPQGNLQELDAILNDDLARAVLRALRKIETDDSKPADGASDEEIKDFEDAREAELNTAAANYNEAQAARRAAEAHATASQKEADQLAALAAKAVKDSADVSRKAAELMKVK